MKNYKSVYEFRNLIQPRYLIASISPAIVGTTLPFWLSPPGFTFKFMTAFEFLIVTFLFHSSFMLLNVFFVENKLERHVKKRILFFAFILIFIICLMGLHLNGEIVLHKGVPSFIFPAFGLSTIFIGLLYVAPPFSFNKRIGGEIIIAEGLGMMPLIGAYLVQVGDITRTVYIASLPIVAVTGLWIWIIEIICKNNDEDMKKKTLVIDFGLDFSGRFGVVIIVILFFLTAIFAVTSASISPLFLIILMLLKIIIDIINSTRKDYKSPIIMKNVEKKVIIVYNATCLLMIVSSLLNY